MKQILFASNNKGKFDEFYQSFKDVGIELIFKGDLNLVEDETTLAANAYSKARSVALEFGMPALGDDSGLFVDCLDGKPGVHSRRWMPGSDADRCEAILKLIEGKEDRGCYIESDLTLVNEQGELLKNYIVKNKFVISGEMRGTYGFGYDSILIPNMLNEALDDLEEMRKITEYTSFYELRVEKINDLMYNQTVIGEITIEIKNLVNFRGRIAREIKEDFGDQL